MLFLDQKVILHDKRLGAVGQWRVQALPKTHLLSYEQLVTINNH